MNALSRWKGHAWIALAIRLYLGAVFLAACYHKILDPASFALDVATYQLLPLGFVNLFAIVLPWVELAAGLLLIAGWKVRPAALLVTAMMIAFMVSLGWALHLQLDISCGCFASQGTAHDPISWRTLARDSAWLLLALYLLALDRQPIGVHALTRFGRNAHG
jgi:putative oxidoreductase